MNQMQIRGAVLAASVLTAFALPSGASASHTVSIACKPSCTVPAGAGVSLTASTDAANPTTPTWDLDGDNQYGDATGVTVERSYDQPGKVNVSVLISDTSTKPPHEEKGTVVVTVTGPDPTPTPTPAATASPTPVATAPVPPVSSAPTAAVRLKDPVPKAGKSLVFDASASTAASGAKIVSYEWDFNGDGRFDAETGPFPTARLPFDARNHTVGLRVSDDQGRASAISTVDFTPQTPPGGCSERVLRGWIDIIAPCIRQNGGVFTIDLDQGAINFGGIEIAGRDPEATIVLDTTGRRWEIRGDGEVVVRLPNTAIGTIELYSLDLERDPIVLPAGAEGDDPNAPGLRLLSLEVGADCRPNNAVPPTVCAELPGGFPFSEEVSLYLFANEAGPGIAIDGALGLEDPLSITGHVTILAQADTGVQLDSLGFETENIDLGVGAIDNLRLDYQRRDSRGRLDVWTGAARAHLNTPSRVDVTGGVVFADGGFNSATFALSGLSVPVGPGITLDSLGGGLGFNPFQISGALGMGFGGGLLGVNGRFLYVDAFRGEPSHLNVGGDLKLTGARIGSADLDVYSDGFTGFNIRMGTGLPLGSPFESGAAGFEGSLSGYFDGYRGADRFQVEGEVRARVLFINGRLVLLVNNQYGFGCAAISVAGITLEGYGRVRWADGNAEAGVGCDATPYRVAPRRPITGTRSASAAQEGGAFAVEVADDAAVANVELTSATGVPRVRITGPDGTSYETPAAGRTAADEHYFAGRDELTHRLVIGILEPHAGRYAIEPLAGSAAISAVRESHEAPDPHVRARVTGHGRARTLRWRLHEQPGMKVRFLVRGRDSGRTIVETAKSAGRARFTPPDAMSRSRTVQAVVLRGGQPTATKTVARFAAAPAFRPGRPGRVVLRRRRNALTIRWGRAAGATGYRVAVSGSDGRRDELVTTPGRRLVRVPRAYRDVRFRVTVRAVGGANRLAGPARRVRSNFRAASAVLGA